MRLTVIFLLLLTICSNGYAQKRKQSDLDRLYVMMQGYYTSEKQSKQDSTYLNITLRMTPIWTKKGKFLYVEQAVAGKEDKPYRVRVYKLTSQKNTIISEIYTLKDDKKWIGKWRTPEFFDNMTEDDIELKAGCEVVLQKVATDVFSGQTGEKSCPSELRGANYATSKVTVSPGKMESWDQGFAYNGNQVWGAEKGGYVFDKILE